jgi:urocanate hydratase
VSPETGAQYEDNLNWIRHAHDYGLVVGSQARILYTDQNGRVSIAMAFNQAIQDGRISVWVFCFLFIVHTFL